MALFTSGHMTTRSYAIETDNKGLAKSPWPMHGQNAQHTGRAVGTTNPSVIQPEPEPNVPQKGLIAYYPFNGNARDEAGHGHDGTVVGATLTVDRHGKPNNSAYQFKPGNSIKIKGLLGKPKNITLSTWVKLDGQQGQWGAEIISLGTSVSIRVDSKLGTGGFSRTGQSSWLGTMAKAHYTGTGWHQIILTFDGNTDKQVTYVDGRQLASKKIRH